MVARVGIIGIGLMGMPMAKNLKKAGYDVTAMNRTDEKAREELSAAAISICTSAAELTQACDVIILMLPNSDVVSQVLNNSEGVLAAVDDSKTIVDMGTTRVSDTREFARAVEAKGGRYLDAPVSGGQVGAEQATLAIMAGGSDPDFAAIKPILDCLGKNVTDVGPIGSGQIAKAANQLIVGITVEAVAEALILAKHAGADPAAVRTAISGGFADSPILQWHGQRMIDHEFEPGGKILTTAKDLRYAQEIADQSATELPLLQLASMLWNGAEQDGLADDDQCAMIKQLDPHW